MNPLYIEFRRTAQLPLMAKPIEEVCEFEVDSTPPIRCRLYSEKEPTHPNSLTPIVLEATMRKRPTDNLVDFLEGMKNIVQQIESQAPTLDRRNIGNRMRLDFKSMEYLELDHIRLIQDDLQTQSTRIASLLRWSANGSDDQFAKKDEPIWEGRMSTDSVWTPFPNLAMRLWKVTFHPNVANVAVCEELEHQLRQPKQTSPLWHELLEEVGELEFKSPRSRLIISVAAVESAVKSFVSNMIPNASWLLTNTQSPPTTKILKEWVPTIATRDPPFGWPTHFEGIDFTEFNAHISKRNRLVHGLPQKEIDSKKLEAFVQQSRDICRLLEFYSGNESALSFWNQSPSGITQAVPAENHERYSDPKPNEPEKKG